MKRNSVGVRFTRTSPDGEEGFPGNVSATVEYVLTNASELRMRFAAKTDAPTPINMCNHTYWNLSGVDDTQEGSTVRDHELTLHCPFYLPVDDVQVRLARDGWGWTGLMMHAREGEACRSPPPFPQIPTGEVKPTLGTPFDFSTPRTVGSRLDEVGGGEGPGALPAGYDHCYVVRGGGGGGLMLLTLVALV